MSQNLKSDAVFNSISDRMQENIEKAKAINGIFLVNITNNGQVVKKWSELHFSNIEIIEFCLISLTKKYMCSFLAIDLKNLKLYEGAPKDVKPDTTLTVTDEDFVDVALGKTNPQLAFVKGKLKISGNVMLTQKLVPLLKTGPKL